MSGKNYLSKQLQTDNKSNVWVEILSLEAQHGSLNLALGFPDFKPPQHILDALSEATTGSNYMLNHYTRGYGHRRLVNILARLYGKLMRQDLNPMSDILVTVGAFEALHCACQGLINPGDEVILLEPYYEPYRELLRLAGAKTVYVPLKPKGESANDWTFDNKELAAAISSRTKAIFLNNPQNPLGKVYNSCELEFIADLCIKHDVICVSDEVYEWLVYDKKQHIRIAKFPGMWERTITIGSAGKSFSVTGWKVGWAVGPAHLISPMQLYHHHSIRTLCTPTQEAVAIAFEKEFELLQSSNSYFNTLQKDVELSRNQLCGYLSDAGIRPIIPGGGYFIVADISSIDTGENLNDCNEDDEPYDLKFVKWAIREKKVTMIPLSIFYSPEHRNLGEKYVRICFVKKEETLAKAKLTLKKWKEENYSEDNTGNKALSDGPCARDVPKGIHVKGTMATLKGSS